MTIEVKFFTIPGVNRRNLSIEIGNQDKISFLQLLGLVSGMTGVNFADNVENYTFMLNDRFINVEDVDGVSATDSDVLTVMPMICGG